MSPTPRARMWGEIALASASAVLAALTVFWKDWLELATGFDPDRHSGAVEWAIARGLPFPDSVFILQHRPETTWPQPNAAADAEAGPEAPTPPAATAAFDPVQYALRNVFRVPGA